MKSADGNPLNSVAAKATLGANAKETPGTPQAAARDADFQATTTRLLAIPTDKQTLDNPEWVKFLLYDNQGQVRKALRSFIPDDRHAQVIVRLKGNQSIDDEGVAAVAVKEEAAKLKIRQRDDGHHRRVDPAQGHQRLPARAACSRSAASPSRSWS